MQYSTIKIKLLGILISLFIIGVQQVCAEKDSLIVVGGEEVNSVSEIEKLHSPHKATLYSAILPGLGQAYNRKYWKIPIIYAGLAASVYYISFNTENYNLYKKAYRDFIIQDPANRSYEEIITEKLHMEPEEIMSSASNVQWFQSALQKKKTYYKRNRDFSYIILIGVYVLNLIDSSVDAHFYDYDISDDLSMQLQPVVMPNSQFNNSSGGGGGIGLQLTLKF